MKSLQQLLAATAMLGLATPTSRQDHAPIASATAGVTTGEAPVVVPPPVVENSVKKVIDQFAQDYELAEAKGKEDWKQVLEVVQASQQYGKTAKTPLYAKFLPEVASALAVVTVKEHLPAELLPKIALIESSGDPTITHPTTKAAGLFQFKPSIAKLYELKDPYNPLEATKAAARLLKDNIAPVQRKIGRKPDAAEMYLAHMQGAPSAGALIVAAEEERRQRRVYERALAGYQKAHPEAAAMVALQEQGLVDMPSWDPNVPLPPEPPKIKTAIEIIQAGNKRVNARQAVLLNGGKEETTAAEFVDQWRRRYETIGEAKSPVKKEKPTLPKQELSRQEQGTHASKARNEKDPEGSAKDHLPGR